MLTFVEDEYIQNYREGNPFWIAKLNDNRYVYEDGERFPRNAWIRLKEFCLQNSLYLTEIHFGFRSNRFSLPSNKDGYFFVRGYFGELGYDGYGLWKLGYVDNDIIKIGSWRVPEFIPVSSETRAINREDECLILK